MTNSIFHDTQFEMLSQQLVDCLDAVPGEYDLFQMAKSLEGDRLAAVLVPLIWQDSDWQILLTKRATHLSHHAGQVSFPGGKLDPLDAHLIDAALREAQEEIRLSPKLVKIMGGLSPVRSRVGFIVQPIVGIVEGDVFDSLRPNPSEVDSIFTISLEHIGQSQNFMLVPRQNEGCDDSYWVVSHPEHHIWGLSAWVLNDFRQRLFRTQILP